MSICIISRDPVKGKELAQNLFMAGYRTGYIENYYLCDNATEINESDRYSSIILYIADIDAETVLSSLSDISPESKIYVISDCLELISRCYKHCVSYACRYPQSENDYLNLIKRLSGTGTV